MRKKWSNIRKGGAGRTLAMSLPSQTVALLQAARDLVKGLPADAVLVLPEMPQIGRASCRERV